MTTILTEKVNMLNLEKIIDNFDELYPLLGRFVDPKKGYKVITDKSCALTQITQMFENHSKTDEVEYSFSSRQKDGRKFSKTPSLQGISRVIRHSISAEYYDDVDIQNAHPTFLVNLCQKNNIPCDNIDYYVKNTDKCRKELMNIYSITKDEAKRVLLITLNKHDPNKKMELENPPAWFSAFYHQCHDARISLLALNPQLKRKKEIKEGADIWNQEGSTCNHLFCVKENEILTTMLEYCQSKRFTVGALCFDGLMVEKNAGRDNNKFLNELEAEIERINKIKVVLTIKPMVEGINLDAYNIDNDKIKKKYVFNDDEARQYFLEQFQPTLKKCNGIFYSKNDFNKWICAKNSTSEKIMKSDLMDKILNNNVLYTTVLKTDFPYCKNVSKANPLITAIMAGVQEDPLFSDKLIDSTKKKLCFLNGVYDFVNKTLTPWSENQNVFSPIVIQDNLTLIRNEDMIKRVNDVLKSIFGEDTDSFLKIQARGLAGHIEDKRWGLLGGERNSGKGVYVNSMEQCFPGYITIVNSGCIMAGHSSINTDEAKKLSWAMDLCGPRLAFSQELAVDDNGKDFGKPVVIDGTVMKKLASGGDTMIGRKNFVDETPFVNTCLFTALNNDVPEISPKDASETLDMFKCPNKFVAQEYIDENPHIDFLKVSDLDLKNEIKTQPFIDALRLRIFDYYETTRTIVSESVKKNKAIYQGDDEFIQFYKNFKPCQDGFISFESIKFYIEKNQINITVAKLKARLIAMGGIEKTKRNKKGLVGVEMVWKEEKEDSNNQDFEPVNIIFE